MKIAVLYYSFTDNNARFAKELAQEIHADPVRISTLRPVTYGTLTMDLVFQRKPAIDFSADALKSYDLALLIAPVWMGQVAFPLRRVLDALKGFSVPYAFLSISGGADGDNPDLSKELTRRTGKESAFVLDQHIRTLLPQEPAPTRDDTSKYQLTAADCEKMVASAVATIQAYFPSAV